MNKKAIAFAIPLALAACQRNSEEIIANVCKPINQNEKLSFDKLVAQHGYDAEEARSVCHQYIVDQRAEAAKMLRGEN